MKRGTPGHPKTLMLAGLLEVPTYSAVGVLESLWHWCGEYAPRGDVGRWPDGAIAAAIGWPVEDAGRLVSGLAEAGWLDRHAGHRYLVHDWPEHCEDSVHRMLARKGEPFADGRWPNLGRLGKEERAAAEAKLRAWAEEKGKEGEAGDHGCTQMDTDEEKTRRPRRLDSRLRGNDGGNHESTRMGTDRREAEDHELTRMNTDEGTRERHGNEEASEDGHEAAAGASEAAEAGPNGKTGPDSGLAMLRRPGARWAHVVRPARAEAVAGAPAEAEAGTRAGAREGPEEHGQSKFDHGTRKERAAAEAKLRAWAEEKGKEGEAGDHGCTQMDTDRREAEDHELTRMNTDEGTRERHGNEEASEDGHEAAAGASEAAEAGPNGKTGPDSGLAMLRRPGARWAHVVRPARAEAVAGAPAEAEAGTRAGAREGPEEHGQSKFDHGTRKERAVGLDVRVGDGDLRSGRVARSGDRPQRNGDRPQREALGPSSDGIESVGSAMDLLGWMGEESEKNGGRSDDGRPSVNTCVSVRKPDTTEETVGRPATARTGDLRSAAVARSGDRPQRKRGMARLLAAARDGPAYRDWWREVWQRMKATPGGPAVMREAIEAVEMSADPVQRERKGVGRVVRPGAFIAAKCRDHLRGYGVVLPPAPVGDGGEGGTTNGHG